MAGGPSRITGGSDIRLDPMDPVARSWMAARIRATGGDATWADRAEAIDPLSAWIASPSSESARRWLRLGQRLEPAWLELVPPSSMGDVEVIESSETAPRSWRSLACHHLANRLMEKPMQAVAWRHLARGQSPRASVVCGALILAERGSNEASSRRRLNGASKPGQTILLLRLRSSKLCRISMPQVCFEPESGTSCSPWPHVLKPRRSLHHGGP